MALLAIYIPKNLYYQKKIEYGVTAETWCVTAIQCSNLAQQSKGNRVLWSATGEDSGEMLGCDKRKVFEENFTFTI